MRTGLAGWTAGLVGNRDPAQPLLTLLEGPARVELSGATTANWVAKSAWLLHDGHGSPARVGLLLPLHWQTACLLLGAVTSGAQVVVAATGADLAGCDVAFVTAPHAQDALDAGVDDIYALSATPLGTPLPAGAALPALVLDYAREVPSYADVWTGPLAAAWSVEVAGTPLRLAELGLSTADRVLVAGEASDPATLGTALAALRDGAAVLLAPEPAGLDLAAVAAQERLTATAGVAIAQVRRVG